jgi:uncharacterized protein YvpB
LPKRYKLFGAIIIGFSIPIGTGIMTNVEHVIHPLSSSKTNSNGTSLIAKAEETNQLKPISSKIQLDVPLLNQMDSPKLYNGCEVTSLAMVLNYKGIEVTKNELANVVAKVPLTYSNGEHGDPHYGFVGNMAKGPGLGVYHGPIFDLAEKFVGDQVEELTSQEFDVLLKKIAEGNPVWAITTSTFAPVSNIQTWTTPQGSVNITYSMHSVVITGYDDKYIYINNPYGIKDQEVNRENFIKAWKQMGKQAIVIY